MGMWSSSGEVGIIFKFEESAADLTGDFVDPVHGNSFELDYRWKLDHIQPEDERSHKN